MATTTPIYGWPVPTSSDLVKNGATDIEALGDAIDTTMATMVPKSIVDAKGDIIAATAADTVSRLAVGTANQVLTVDSSTATGLKWATPAGGSFNTGYAYTSSTQNTSSSSYVDLSTTTSVTVTTGTKALVTIKSAMGNEALGGGVWAHCSFAISGATTLAAADERSISSYFTFASQWINEVGAAFVVTGLTAGSNVFTLKFNANGGYTTPATFYKRSISVVDLGS